MFFPDSSWILHVFHGHSASLPEDASSDSSSDSWQFGDRDVRIVIITSIYFNNVLSATSSQLPAGRAACFMNNVEVKRTSVATDSCDM